MTSEVEARSAGTYSTTDTGLFVVSHSDRDRSHRRAREPIGHGAGRDAQDRIYDGYPDLRLDLVESRTFEGGLRLLEYVPTVLDGPPGTTGPPG
jgi:hypothetical protein